jgi:hypothetical protein
MSFIEALAWASTSEGINAILGVLLSWVVELFPEWADISPFHKRLYLLVASLAIPLGAAGLAVATGYREHSIELTYWPAVEAGAAAFIAGQIRHGLTLSRRGK